MIMPLVALFALDYHENLSSTRDAMHVLYVFVFVSTGIIPLIFTFFLYKMGYVTSFHLKNRTERILPFLVTLIFYSYVFVMFRMRQMPYPYTLLMLGATISVACAFLINLKWKISIHMIGVGGLMGTIMGLKELLDANVQVAFILAVLIAGLVGFSRLYLGAHRQQEVYAGWAVGFASVYLTILVSMP